MTSNITLFCGVNQPSGMCHTRRVLSWNFHEGSFEPIKLENFFSHPYRFSQTLGKKSKISQIFRDASPGALISHKIERQRVRHPNFTQSLFVVASPNIFLIYFGDTYSKVAQILQTRNRDNMSKIYKQNQLNIKL